MAVRDNFHSVFVAWMKIVLPLLALGLLSTVFLFSRKVDLDQTIPFSQIDLTQRAHDQGATNPRFAGVATGGEHVSFQAEKVRPDPAREGRVLADVVRAELRLNGGAVVHITSDRGESDQIEYSALLDGNVKITTTTGYDVRTDRITAQFDTMRAETPGPVTGTGPLGALEAGRMLLTSEEEDGTAHLLFTDGVKLIYTPPKIKD
ncbi:LPS export ABC transporter periplasmic protein LptC [Roseovarius sp. ZX-A-9]|uniref:LPS export ABC transporter periplasmic protein LptC n=1 Tax=Roseovarius sp. ZX-A-9 TaxID=3014783 RepID=UPI00232BBFD6|nr:LPS export ABC transporter periplasmic protein LptC [Roseovarius sp. ZX-A-9]